VAGWLVAATHVAIAVVGAAILGPGSPGAGSLDQRMAYVAGHTGAWQAAWLVPPVAALSLLWFTAELRARLARDGVRDAPLVLGLIAAATGAGIEGAACAVAAGALPVLAAEGARAGFLAVERVVVLGTTSFGNAGFTLSQIVFVAALGRAGAPRAVTWPGWATALAGVGFLLAGVLGIAPLVLVANAAMFVALVAYAIGVARW
jgi:hypothetical protein